VGGTTVNRTNGKFTSETYWTGGGGGISTVYTRPAYQNVISGIVGNHRGSPDISAVGNPNTGVAVYDADGGFGWQQIGGTSVSSPLLAGIVNGGGLKRKSTNAELTAVYNQYNNPTQYKNLYRDIKAGGSNCKVGWDICTGVGAPLTFKGK
jgi:subtilase family serine protease